jgi:hypothetical protein
MRSDDAPQRKSLTPDTPLAPVPSEILDQFVSQGAISHEELDAAVRRFKKAIIERALGGELTHHLGYPPGGSRPEETTNHRNGTGSKRVLTDAGALAIEVPRDREGTFEPRFIPKHERRFTGFDDEILALYARWRPPDLISTVTDGIVAEVTAWQSRPLEQMYPVVFFDARRNRLFLAANSMSHNHVRGLSAHALLLFALEAFSNEAVPCTRVAAADHITLAARRVQMVVSH